MTKTNDLINRGKKCIPGLTQLLSKRPDQFAPDAWPTYFSRALGTEIWDLDGNKYLDMSISGIGANILGYCDPDVNSAVMECVVSGNSCSLNAPEEVVLAELLCSLHPWAEKVRYTRSGGEAMAVAVRIARAASGKDRVAFCGYHGWSDWYLAANLQGEKSLEGHLLPGLSPLGVPRGLSGTALPFKYNDIAELEAIFHKYPGEVGVVVMEPLRSEPPAPGYLDAVRQIADKHNAVLVFDEVSAGFRLNAGGSHLSLGVRPDIAVFAKAVSNGYPMAAIIGTAAVMDSVEKTFISSTYWTDRIGPVAALATIEKYRKCGVEVHLGQIGAAVQGVWKKAAESAGLCIDVYGINPMSYFKFVTDEPSVVMTYYVQEMLKRGILASNRFYANYAQNDAHVAQFSTAVAEVFADIAIKLQAGNIAEHLEGQVAKPGFHRLN